MLLFKKAVLKPVMEELQEKGGNLLCVKDEGIYLMLGARSTSICGQGEIGELYPMIQFQLNRRTGPPQKEPHFFSTPIHSGIKIGLHPAFVRTETVGPPAWPIRWRLNIL